MYLVDAFSKFLLDTKADDIPARDIESVARSVFDAVGTGLAGRGSPQGRIVESYVRNQGGSPQASIIGSTERVPAPLAALANGTFVHADDYDDMGSYGHQSAALVPALLAASQLGEAVSGQDFLVAFTLGFEVAMSLFSEGKYDQYEGTFHATSLFGAVAAAGAASRLLGLSHRETSATLELAAGQASGIGRNVGTMVKPLHGGLAANEAITSAVLASAGIEGFGPIFEGAGGFMATFSRHRTMRPERVIESLGQPFKASARLAIKAFPCCGSNQSALHAIGQIMSQENLRYEDIRDVTVDQMADTSPVLRYQYPQRGLNGKFSIHYTVGNLILKGALTIDDFSDDEVRNPRVLEACQRVRAGVMSRWDERHTDRVSKGNPVTIRTVDGRIFRKELPRSEMPGSAKYPFSWEELTLKFRANASRELTSAKAIDDVVRLWSNLADVHDMNDAIDSFSVSARPQAAA